MNKTKHKRQFFHRGEFFMFFPTLDGQVPGNVKKDCGRGSPLVGMRDQSGEWLIYKLEPIDGLKPKEEK